MKLLILGLPLFCLLACLTGNKQKTTSRDCPSEYDTLSSQKVYLFVDKMPEYIGGNSALLQFILNNFEYPKQEQFQATFLIEFIINEKGKLIASRIKGKDLSELSEVEKVVLRIMEKTPKWKEGSCNDKKVSVKMFFPLKL